MSKLDPKFQAKLQDLVESGLGPEEIIQHFREEDEKKALEETEGPPFEEEIPDEIKVIAQALAYRGIEEGDIKDIYRLINESYSPESNDGKESFRIGNCVSRETFQGIIDDPDYHWLIVEAPGRSNGDGGSLILGVVCYSTSGTSKRNGNSALPQFFISMHMRLYG